jgi:peptidyl-prolyl cis-trans isomerase SurA
VLKRTAAFLVALVLVGLAPACTKQQPKPGPDVWAVVNGKQILRSEVEKYYRSQAQSRAPSPEEALSFEMSILDELINNEILLERAGKMGLVATDSEVEGKLAELRAPYTEEEFQNRLRERGLTVEDVKNDIRRQLSIQKLLNREIVSKINVTDQDVANAYNENRGEFDVTEPEYHLAQIVVTPERNARVRNRREDDAATEAQARQKVAMLLAKLKAGTDFAALAADYTEDPTTASTGGDLGFIPQSALDHSDPALKRAVMALQPGQVSGVIHVNGSYRILKLIARVAPGQRALSDPQVQQEIRQTLRNRKEQLLRAAYLATLRDQARVTNYFAEQILESGGRLATPSPQVGAQAPAPVPGAPAAPPGGKP